MLRRLYPFFAAFLALCFCLSPVQAKPDLPPEGTDVDQEMNLNLMSSQDAAGDEPLIPSLATPGTSYSYAQTLGTEMVPYFEDNQHFNYPGGLAINGNDIYVMENDGGRVMKINGTNVSKFTGIAGIRFYEDNLETMMYPGDAAVSGDYLWVADNSRVVKYELSTGERQMNFPENEPWNQGSDNDRFREAAGIAFDSIGRMYVSDTWNHRIQVYTFDGEGNPQYLKTLGETGSSDCTDEKFSEPKHITIYNDKLYVADRQNNRVKIYDVSDASADPTFPLSGIIGGCESGNDNTHLTHPEGVAVNGSYIAVVDTENNRIQVFQNNSTRDYLTSLGSWGSGNDQFWNPSDLVFNDYNDIYIADRFNFRVQKWTKGSGDTWNAPTGGTDSFGTTRVPYLTDDSHFNRPRTVVDRQGNLIVIEEGGQRMLRMKPDGTLICKVGVPGIEAAFGIGLEEGNYLSWPRAAAVDKSGKVYVGGNFRVMVFNGCTYQSGFGSNQVDRSDPTYFENITGVAVDASGNIYVSDANLQVVRKFKYNKKTKTYQWLSTIGTLWENGNDNAHFSNPQGLAVDASGSLYVADNDNCRVQKFTKKGTFSKTFGVTGKCDFSSYAYLPGNPSGVTVDAKGNVFISTWSPSIEVYDKKGAYVTSIGRVWNGGYGFARGSSSAAVDKKGNVYFSSYDDSRVIRYAPSLPYWKQLNINGQGDPSMTITSLATFRGTLYAGGGSFQLGRNAVIWKRASSGKWTVVKNSDWGTNSNTSVDHLYVFNNKLYASTVNCKEADENGACTYGSGGEIWRSKDGKKWEMVVGPMGFGDWNNVEIFRMGSLGGKLCASTWRNDETNGSQLWCSPTGDLGTWVKDALSPVGDGFGDGFNQVFPDFMDYNGYSYVTTLNGSSVSPSHGGQVWRRPAAGGDWTMVAQGFGDPESNTIVSSLAVFNKKLYAGVRSSKGSFVMRCTTCDGTDWEKVTNGVPNPASMGRTAGLIVIKNVLYATFGNWGSGLQVWYTKNGTTWTRAGAATPPDGVSGFGNPMNFDVYHNNSLANYKNSLVVGAYNYALGSEVWKYCPGKSKCK